jgi:uncharacterized membrane protein YfcA
LIVIAVGLIIGSILGLTGAGGAAFALPLLILVVGLPVQQAIGLSLATVAMSAGYGAIRRLNSGDIFWRAVVILSLGGVIAAPVGKYLATFVPDAWLLTGFTLLCLAIASHMWRRCQAESTPIEPGLETPGSTCGTTPGSTGGTTPGSTCGTPSDPMGAEGVVPGVFEPDTRSVRKLALSGLGVGALSGLFGIGGGFLVVPLLHAILGLSMRQAMASSLVIITFISSAGFATHALISESLDWLLIAELGLGGTLGMYFGSHISQRCSPAALQKMFSVGLMVLAAGTLGKVAMGAL